MQAQVEKGAGVGELLCELRSKNVSSTIKEITSFGIRFEQNSQGEVAGGKYSGRDMQTTQLFLKNDGTYDWEAKDVQRTIEGDIVVASSHGTGKMTGPTAHKGEGEVVFMTQAAKLSWLNMKKGRVEFSGDIGTGESQAKVFTV